MNHSAAKRTKMFHTHKAYKFLRVTLELKIVLQLPYPETVSSPHWIPFPPTKFHLPSERQRLWEESQKEPHTSLKRREGRKARGI